ncbi:MULTISPECIES: hypothetical protein [Acidithiobacillaceae]|jgi:hypothetical protein|uniref:Uncharacterized protein n=1 Tax=Igneacidithiobacillus copahuensis TaxID=2724909 RepID=A0AAE3CK34_9PROT|nr:MULTISPECIES: hypothetical protein [Acidithiobacillaceae]MBU2763343.1 hypothetical protein [Acidithiobacillus caldus]MBU2771182.1 hypothetical protein [Acidithiobacillus caldus]MBU2788391.1 hypothetical protein [Igneacidithiobacillus copahuensis]MBU2796371.1 hypothetical protein [Acidithiobacillus sp. VAN18-2]
MQRASITGEPSVNGFRSHGVRVAQRLTPRISPRQIPSRVTVSYRDGAVLTFLFDRSTTIVDIRAMISRAGHVRKVILWDEMPSTGYTRHKAVM